MGIPYTDTFTAISAVVATTTSGGYDISKRQKIAVQFIAAGGSSVFTIDMSNDGTNWITGVAFLDAAATTGTGTYVTSKSVSSTTAGAIITPGFKYMRVVATWTSGTATAIIECGG